MRLDNIIEYKIVELNCDYVIFRVLSTPEAAYSGVIYIDGKDPLSTLIAHYSISLVDDLSRFDISLGLKKRSTRALP